MQRDRFRRVCEFQPAAIPPDWHCFGFWGQTVERWRGEGLPADRTPEEHFGMDSRPVVPVAGHWHIAMDPPFERIRLAEDESTLTYRNEYGATVREYKEHGERSMPQFIEFPVKSRKDFEDLEDRLDPGSPGRYPDWDATRSWAAGSTEEVCLMISGCFGFQRDLVGYENLALLYHDDPDLIHAMSRRWATLERGICEEVLGRLEVDFVYVWEDMACKSGPLIGPPAFERFVLPYYREVMSLIRGLGVRCIAVDSDGDNSLLMPLFLEGGIDAFLPIEIASGMDPRVLRKRYGRQLRLFGGIDKRVLSRGKRAIERELRDKVPALLLEGGYIPAIDHSVPPDVSFENYSCYVDLLREITRNPSRFA